jgi:hypothetical protein
VVPAGAWLSALTVALLVLAQVTMSVQQSRAGGRP